MLNQKSNGAYAFFSVKAMLWCNRIEFNFYCVDAGAILKPQFDWNIFDKVLAQWQQRIGIQHNLYDITLIANSFHTTTTLFGFDIDGSPMCCYFAWKFIRNFEWSFRKQRKTQFEILKQPKLWSCISNISCSLVSTLLDRYTESM